MEDGVCKIDRQNKKCSWARKSGRRKNNAGTDEEQKKFVGPLAKKDALEGMVLRKKV